MSHDAEALGDEMGLEGEMGLVEDDVVDVVAAPFGVDEDFAWGSSPDLVRDGAVPVDVWEWALEFLAVDADGVHVGLPLWLELVVAVSEEPEDA